MKLMNILGSHFRSNESDRDYIKRKTGWSDEIVNSIGSREEARVYMKAHLREQTIDGRKALTNPKVKGRERNCDRTWFGKEHPNYRGWSNRDLMGEGYPPHDRRGDAFELHHIGQRQDSPYAELTWAQHMGGGNNTILHRCGKESEIDRRQFEGERSRYWQARYSTTKQ